jgi:hypothetical protein
MKMVVTVYKAATDMQGMWRARVARKTARALVHQHVDKVYSPENHKHYYFWKKSGKTCWTPPKQLEYKPHFKCTHKRHWNMLVREEMVPVLSIDQAALRVQNMWKKRKARQFFRGVFRLAWDKRFSRKNNQYYYYHKATGDSVWEKPKKLGETPRVERDVVLWDCDFRPKQLDYGKEGTVCAFLKDIGLLKFVEKANRLQITGICLLMMDLKDLFMFGLDNMQAKRVMANLRMYPQKLKLPPESDLMMEALRERMKVQLQEELARRELLRSQWNPQAKPRDPVDDLPDVKLFKWKEMGEQPKANEMWYNRSSNYEQLGKTQSDRNDMIAPEFHDSEIYHEINVLKCTSISILPPHVKKEHKRLCHAINCLKGWCSNNKGLRGIVQSSQPDPPMEDTRSKVIENDGLEALVNALTIWKEDEEIVEAAIHCLGKYASTQDINLRIIKCDGLKQCMLRLAEHQFNVGICIEAMYVATRFTTRPLEANAAVGAMAIEAAQCVMTNFEEDYEPNQWAIKVLWNLAQYGDLPIKLHKANTETTMGKFWDYMENEVVFVQVQIAIKHHCTDPRTEIEHAYDLLQILKTDPDEVKAHAIRLKRERETREEKRRLIKEREALNLRQEASAAAALLRNTHYSEESYE